MKAAGASGSAAEKESHIDSAVVGAGEVSGFVVGDANSAIGENVVDRNQRRNRVAGRPGRLKSPASYLGGVTVTPVEHIAQLGVIERRVEIPDQEPRDPGAPRRQARERITPSRFFARIGRMGMNVDGADPTSIGQVHFNRRHQPRLRAWLG